jgi:hypothetical protein
MNERIKELAEQAKEYADTKYSKLVSTSRWGDSVPGIRELYTEKLAELIVQECADYLDNFNKAIIGDVGIAGFSLKKHFGVEE